ncbi:androgen-dependent TFPI-regulating protein [Galendromus occidentalis]|uniref:Androgen-dependent TFPI-regulating protein n=1 Tax=Galendromus occidentalis TaxID=34638 RepID=A0AAJ6VWD1_9ACAR|nr:androgen-dependent TFPI-regulating protein [Galendromus occidentalis]
MMRNGSSDPKSALKMSEAPPKLAKLLHISAFLTYAYTIYYSHTKVNVPLPYPEFAYAGKAKYLTQWNLYLSGLYFGLCVLQNLLRSKSLARVRDYIFCSVSLPSSIFVTILFWGIYAVDRELIFPKEIEPYYPNWVNHCSHTLIAFTAISEALLYSHGIPSNRKALPGILAWFGFYLVWVLYLGVSRGIWVYQVMRVLEPAGLTAFFLGCTVAVLSLHLTCHALLRVRDSLLSPQAKQQKVG